MLNLYNIGIRLYQLGVSLASTFNPKAKKWLDGRIGIIERIERETGDFIGETLWVHCASLGEFEMARPVIERSKTSDPSLRIVLTFFSPSGFEVRKSYPLADHVFYLPLDTSTNAERFVAAVKPSIVIFVKYDLWLHHLKEAKRFGAKLLLISAQFRADQSYFKFYGRFGKEALRLFDQIFLVDENSKILLHSIGIVNTIVCGDTRYDRVMEIAQTAETDATIETWKGDSKLVVCGSTWPEDEKLFVNELDRFPNTKWLVAPHEVGEENIKRLEMMFPNAVRLSKLKVGSGTVILVDSIGKLNKLYKYADVAYVGGGFRNGLHNILEATAFGVPTIFGPDHSRFPDAGEMAKKGLAFSIKDTLEFTERLNELLASDQTQLQISICNFMSGRTGATKAILKYMKPH